MLEVSQDVLGKFTNSFAPRLGEIGHTARGDAAGTHTGELRNLIDQMGLIAVAEFCSHACRADSREPAPQRRQPGIRKRADRGAPTRSRGRSQGRERGE
jgi:hypothetical protein